MQSKSDAQLLREYAEHSSELAFTEIVTRHTNLVYSAAVRQMDSADTAAEITQSVFMALARGARTLSMRLAEDASLAGWLCRSARNISLNLRRDEFRQHARERQAMEDLNPISETALDWEGLCPVLDEAMSELSEPDYDALVMRFFNNQDLRSIGKALGVNDDAAQKRVSRALDKLRQHLSRRGISSSATALSIVLSTNAVQAAPVGLAVTISSAAALAGTTIATTATATVTKAIAMTTLQKTLISATLAAAVGTGIYEDRRGSALRSQNRLLQQQQAPLAEQVQQLTRERDQTASELAASRDENERLNQNTVELARLRAEVRRLQATQHQVAQVKNTSDPFIQSVLGLTTRAAELNQHLEQMPDKKIPELQWLNENDWLNAAREASFDTEANIRQSLSRLRSRAKAHLYPILQNALLAYIKANNEQLPDDLSRLGPYFDKPVEDAILQRYKLLRTGSTKGLGASDWVIVEKAPVDKDYDTRFKMGLYCMQIGSTGLGEAETFDDNP